MNKRLIALLLCLVMMLSVFLTACSEDSEEDAKDELEEAKVASNMTLTMWIVSESPVANEIRDDVTKAINSLTKAKYKVQLDIRYLSEEEYYTELTTAIAAFEQTKKEQNANKPVVEETTSGETDGTTAEEIVTDEHGMYRDNYPIVLENQVDIIYIGDLEDSEGNLLMSGQQMYTNLMNKGWLAVLDDAIKGDSKKLKEFVSPTLLSAVQEKGVTYAVPNNNVIGEYTYMCLNKEMMDRYALQGHLIKGSIKSFYNEHIYQFIDQIIRYEKDNLLPVDATYEECLEMLAFYWNINPDDYSINSSKFSIFGTPIITSNPSRGENMVSVESLFENEDFVSHYLTLNKYRMAEDGNTYLRGEENADTEYDHYGIKFVKGSLEELTVEDGVSYYYDDNGDCYYVVPVAYPTASADDIYGNMFAVATTTLDVERSMQIITYLNTNTEIRNLLQYGIRDQHYTYENGELVRVADKNGNFYEMDIYATGNAFLAYPEPGMNASIWENGKKQNRESLVDPLLGFNLAEFAASNNQFGTPVTQNHGKAYNTTFRSGLSKEVLSQNEKLAEWLAACDEKGAGVYVFRGREKTLNNEYSEVLYFYNSNGAYRFDFESVEVPKETGAGFYRNNIYSYTEDADVTGEYTLTIVYDLCHVRYEGTYSAVQVTTQGEEEVRTELAVDETVHSERLEFDLYNTDSYKVSYHGDLTLAHFYENKEIYNVLVDWYDMRNVTSVTNFVLSWVDTESSTEKDYHTYIIYRKNADYITTTDFIPAQFGNKLILSVNSNVYPDHEVTSPGVNEVGIEIPPKKYTLHYVLVEVDKGVEVEAQYNSMTTVIEEVDGKYNYIVGDPLGKDDASTINKKLDAPVDFRAYGMLNTELVKFMVALDAQIVDLLNNCKTYAELEKMVSDLGVVLNTEEELISLTKNLPDCNAGLKKVVMDANGLIKGNMKTLFYQISHITNYATMDEVVEYGLSASEVSEDRVLYYSPYGIYYLWMEAYQYLPQ